MPPPNNGPEEETGKARPATPSQETPVPEIALPKTSAPKAPGRFKRGVKALAAYACEGGLAAHLQAAAALFAVALAVFTLNAWKEQERIKKRSELSFEIMTRTAFVGTEIRNIYEWATVDLQSADIDQFIKGVVASNERDRIRKLAPKIDDLDLYNTIAEFTFNDERLNNDLGFIVATVRVLNDCYDSLERRSEIDPSARLARWHVSVVSIAHDLGWEWSKRIGNSTPIVSSGCGFDKADFQKRVARIKKRLQPELELTGKSLSSGDEAKPRSAEPVAPFR